MGSSAEGVIREGFVACQMARALIRNPDFPNIMRESLSSSPAKDRNLNEREDIKSKCIHCNLCVVSTLNINEPVGCPYYVEEQKEKKQGGRQIEIKKKRDFFFFFQFDFL